MLIGGFQKLSLIDFPEKISCIVFTVGCNFRCPFCYNLELVLPSKIPSQPTISEKEIFDFLKKRKGKIDGVVITGGEPTLHPDLEEFVKKIKELGFLVKLDTNGYNPDVIYRLVKKNLLDYVAMDIKAPKEKYEFFSGIKLDLERIQASVDFLKKNYIDYEFRTTLAPGLTKKDILEIGDWISGAKKYFLQKFFNKKEIISPEILKQREISEKELKEIQKIFEKKFKVFKIRNL